MHIHYLQHVPFEGLGSIQDWAEASGHSITCTRLYAGEALPRIETMDMLIVMGGPMNVYEEKKYPWLAGEKRYIERAIVADKTILGICLGAQLIADVLGAKVFSNPFKEIGWFPVQRTGEALTSGMADAFPLEMEAFHWHGDTFEIPSGAIHLAKSEACQNQAFLYGEKVLGLQFHLETTRSDVKNLIQNCGDEIAPAPFIQPEGDLLAPEDKFHKINRAMHNILDHLGN